MKKVYVLCPSFFKTGGTELLHQFVYTLNQNGCNATIAYYGKSKESEEYLNPAFKQYVTDYVLLDNVIKEDAYFVIPEVKTIILKEINPKNCIVWWESVDNYRQTYLKDTHFNGLLRSSYHVLKRLCNRNKSYEGFNVLKQAKAHLVQSYYAKDFLNKHNINDNVYFLKDYINELYIQKESKVDLSKKENIVLYNPKKGRKVTKKIIKKFSDYKFVPLINMTNDEVQANLAKAKVYIDFGSHPGMDRFPREAALMHCCVITNKCGSAKFYEDVPIDDKYKFNDYHLNYKNLKNTIDNCFDNYIYCDKEYNHYRDFIKSQYEEFIRDSINAYKVMEEE